MLEGVLDADSGTTTGYLDFVTLSEVLAQQVFKLLEELEIPRPRLYQGKTAKKPYRVMVCSQPGVEFLMRTIQLQPKKQATLGARWLRP